MENTDIELALSGLSENDIPQINSTLSNDYICVDRTDKDWGLVIRLSKDIAINNIDNLIVSFLEGLDGLREIICSSSPILRIGIYNHMANYTLKLNSFKLLNSFNISLEASIYPTDAE